MRLLIGTTFYTSLILKKAPGTVSSFAIFLLFLLADFISIKYRLFILFFLGVSHFICFPYFETKYSVDDPPLYTLDEAFAMVSLSVVFGSTYEWTAAFFVFRFFDILKPLGIKRLENMKSVPSNIRNIADDVIAACYTYLLITAFTYGV